MKEILILGWATMASVSTYATWRYRLLMAQHGRPQEPARCVVIVPVKGRSQTTDRFLASLRDQDHPLFRVIFAVESGDDPAVAAIASAFADAPDRAETVVAGLAPACSQKIWNMRAAMERLRDDDALVVFADADVILPADWLAVLNWAVVDQGQQIVTGYRLILPTEPTFAGVAAAASNLSVALAPRLTGLTAAWGGTMAMQRATLAALDLDRYWLNALSDDMQLTAAASAKGILVHTNRRTLLPSPWTGDLAALIAFGIRQFRILRLNDAIMHVGILAGLLIPVLGFAAALADTLGGGWYGPAGFAVVLLAGLIRGRLRRQIVAEALGLVPGVGDPGRHLDGLLRPLWWPVFLAVAVMGSFGRTIRWAGITYRCAGPRVTAILRPGTSA
ncbi:glycosyltransferase family 2 protein [Phreatobacter sp.]|uniref:glycosyltransferase family 2 protein n=1 Tax=Phreatobacter sp. TaxID=1966341 RepID=UPI003F71AC12